MLKRRGRKCELLVALARPQTIRNTAEILRFLSKTCWETRARECELIVTLLWLETITNTAEVELIVAPTWPQAIRATMKSIYVCPKDVGEDGPGNAN